jgi:RNA 2',3'-cyclic 3'-phosphodiesterase
MYRLFVAVDLPEAARESIANICFGVPGIKWTPMNHLHLTMRFIGESGDEEYEMISYSLSEIVANCFDLNLAGTGHFGNKVLWVGIEQSEGLLTLKKNIDTALLGIGIIPEHRKFSPHITLARYDKSTSDKRIAEFLSVNGMFRAPAGHVDCFHLYSSVLTPTGAIHRQEKSFRLV